jgi:hypothetical protein
MLLLIGPAVAVIGIVAVIFVMRHKSVEKRSMYSARRSQIEHKVRAARQRTLAPGRRAEKEDRVESFTETASASPTLTYEPSAYAPPPVAPPPRKGHPGADQPAWDSGPVRTPASPPSFAPEESAPTFTPPPPAYEAPPAYEPPSQPPSAQPEWTPTPQAPAESATPAPERAATSAGAGASWSVVGESKASAESEPVAKKASKRDAQTGAWQLASGEVAGDEPDDAPRKPSAAVAIAQYAVLVVGLVMVLIGVVVMVANSHGS